MQLLGENLLAVPVGGISAPAIARLTRVWFPRIHESAAHSFHNGTRVQTWRIPTLQAPSVRETVDEDCGNREDTVVLLCLYLRIKQIISGELCSRINVIVNAGGI